MSVEIVNSKPYRPVELFHVLTPQVPARYGYDRWAFGCLVFDMMQIHPRLTNSSGQQLRLFSKCDMSRDQRQVMAIRDSRLCEFTDKSMRELIIAAQDVLSRRGLASASVTLAEHCRWCVDASMASVCRSSSTSVELAK